ncbi:sodium-coupled monocarboxylate transporter 1 isoform X3 [Zeugodacus cucurbitae]|nr:sodium-coupled monocarboxylate transporter 1 isoform X3 [Zeugodacus cucurbitae]
MDPTASTLTMYETTVVASNTIKSLNVMELSSSLQHFGVLDYFVFMLMLAVCAVIGLYFGFIERNKKQSDNEQRRGSEALDYLMGGRKMKVFPVSLSLVASFVSGISLLGTSTEIYVYGTQYAFILITLVISGIISWYVFLPVFCNLQLTSTYEYIGKRFSRRMQLFSASLFVIKAIIWLPIAIYVPALTFSQISGVGVHTITPIVIAICIFYTTVGGIKCVVWTDAIQSLIMYSSLITLIVKGTYDVGGIKILWQRNAEGGRLNTPDITLDPTVRMSIMSVIVGGTFFKLQNTSINQPTIQRFMSLSSLKDVKQTLVIFSFGVIVLYLGCIYVGLVAFATYYKCDPISTGLAEARDQLIPLLVMQVLGKFPGLPGLFVSAVFSAALSSISTLLNSLAAVILEDFIKPNVRIPISENTVAIVMRSIVIVFGASAIGLVYIVERMGMVLQFSATMQSISYGPMLGIFSTGVLMPWISEKSVLVGSITAVLSMAYICISAQVAIVTGSFRHTKLLVSVEECDYEYDMNRYLNSTNEYEVKNGTAIHHISFLLYTMLGAFITIVVSNIASLYFGGNKISDVDQNLIAPFIAKYIQKKNYKSVKTSEKFELNEMVG